MKKLSWLLAILLASVPTLPLAAGTVERGAKQAGELASQMQVQNIAFSLSRETRLAAEQKLADQAVAAFRDKAQATTKLFGYSGYTIREVSLNESGGVMPMPRMYAAKAMSDSAGAPIPVEGGKSQVTVSVNGSVQMVK